MDVSVSARLSAYYVAHFACIGILLPFWSVWLASRDLDPIAIGVLSSLGFWISIVTSPVAGRIADGAGGARRTMTVLAIISVAGFATFSRGDSITALAVLVLITFGAHSALLPLAESVAQARAHAGDAHYGRVRLWGSLAFIAASFGAGWAIDRSDISIVPWLMVAGAVACLLAAQALPSRTSGAVTRPGGLGASEDASGAIAWRPLLAGIVLANAIQASHHVYYGFASIDWAAHDLGARTIGALWATGVLAEVVLFALSPSLVTRVGPAQLMMLGAVAACVRWLLLATIEHPAAIAGAQLLHALSFGATHLGGMGLVRGSLPAHRLATGQGIYTAIAGISSGIAAPIAGALYASFHRDAYLGAAALAAVTGLVAIVLAPAIVRRAALATT